MRRYFKLLALMLMVLLVCVACGTDDNGSGGEPAAKPELVTGPLEFQVVDVNSDEFDQLYSDEEFSQWYSEGYEAEGADTFATEEALYILLSAGEKSTGGYSIDNVIVVGTEDSIELTADLHVPGPDSLVTQGITYPHVLLKLAPDNRVIAFEEFNEITTKEMTNQETPTATGTFVGQIDSNSIEIKVSGVSEDVASKAFQLEESTYDFENDFGVKSGDQVEFTYFEDENGRLILKTIEKI